MAQSGMRLVVVADDFGRSASINRAIAEAHEKGILTAAGVMAGGEAFDEAVGISIRTGLSLGLHLTLCDGASVLRPAEIPGLVNARQQFVSNPSLAWIRYSRRALLPQIEREIRAQFDKAETSGVRLHHVDGHHHLHLHPAIFPLLCKIAAEHGVRWIRIAREPLSYALTGRGRGFMPVLEWTVFEMLEAKHRRACGRHGLRSADPVFGLSRTGNLGEKELLVLLERLKGARGVAEIFMHPDSAGPAGRRELEALLSPRVRSTVTSAGIGLAGYDELADVGEGAVLPAAERE